MIAKKVAKALRDWASVGTFVLAAVAVVTLTFDQRDKTREAELETINARIDGLGKRLGSTRAMAELGVRYHLNRAMADPRDSVIGSAANRFVRSGGLLAYLERLELDGQL